MAQWLQMHTFLAKNPNLVPSTLVGQLSAACIFSSERINLQLHLCLGDVILKFRCTVLRGEEGRQVNQQLCPPMNPVSSYNDFLGKIASGAKVSHYESDQEHSEWSESQTHNPEHMSAVININRNKINTIITTVTTNKQNSNTSNKNNSLGQT